MTNNSPYIVRCYYSSDTNAFTPNPNNAFVVVNVEAGKRYFVKGAKRYSPSGMIRWCTSSSAPASSVSVIRTGTFLQSDTFVLDVNPSENYLSLFLCGDSDYNGYGTLESAISTNGENLAVDNGYKIPITCAEQTTPVYLGQTQTVRKIKKLVLTGDETNWEIANDTFRITITDALGFNMNIIAPVCCSHYVAKTYAGVYNGNEYGISVRAGSTESTRGFAISKGEISGVTAFKSYLSEQYAAGTPVTVWYVLAAPTTGIINEALCKIGDYADELSSTNSEVTIPTAEGQNTLTVDTDLQPSEVTITYIKEGQ